MEGPPPLQSPPWRAGRDDPAPSASSQCRAGATGCRGHSPHPATQSLRMFADGVCLPCVFKALLFLPLKEKLFCTGGVHQSNSLPS